MLLFLWVFLLLGICAERMRMSLSRVSVAILSWILWKYCAQMIVVVTLSLLKASIHSKYKSLSYSPPSHRTLNSFIAQIKFCLSSSLRILGFLIQASINKKILLSSRTWKLQLKTSASSNALIPMSVSNLFFWILYSQISPNLSKLIFFSFAIPDFKIIFFVEFLECTTFAKWLQVSHRSWKFWTFLWLNFWTV